MSIANNGEVADRTGAGPLVSVVLPTWNRAYCIARTIESVLAQTYRNLELIVVDDGSNDGTGDLIARRFGSDGRLRYVYQPNAGVCAARNEGFRHSRGEYIALIDSDDLWEPWKVQLQVACLGYRPEVGMIWTDMSAVDPHGRRISRSYLRTYYSAYRWFTAASLFTSAVPLARFAPELTAAYPDALFHAGDISSAMLAGNLVHTPTVMLRRDRWAAAGGFDPEFQYAGEDYDFHLRTCRLGPVGFLDVPAIVYQVGRPDQITHKHDVTMARNFLKIIEPVLENPQPSVDLPRDVVRAVLGDAHAWLGSSLVDAGQNSAARHHLLISLRYLPTIRALYRLLISLVPSAVRPPLRSSLQRLKAGYARIMRPHASLMGLFLWLGTACPFEPLV